MLTLGQVLFGKYKVTKRLGAGGFAEVYQGRTLGESQRIAIKVEKTCNEEFKTVEHEAVILSKLTDIKQVPRLVFLKKTNKQTLMGMKLLGQDLFVLRKAGRFSPTQENMVLVAYQLLCIIEKLHARGIYHLDIKPDNIVIGKRKNTTVHLIDFGIAVDTTHKTGKNYSMLGSPLFCSTRRMENRPVARKDDLESWLYTMTYLVSLHLPWESYSVARPPGWKQSIIDCKKTESAEVLCKSLPSEFVEITHYIRSLSALDCPSYRFIKGLLEMAADRLHVDVTDGLKIAMDEAPTSAKSNSSGPKSIGKSGNTSPFLRAISVVERLRSSGVPSIPIVNSTQQPVEPDTPKLVGYAPTITEPLRAHLNKEKARQRRRGSACD